MITVRRTTHHDDPPWLIFRDHEVISEARLFLKRHFLQGVSTVTLRAYAFDLLTFYRFLDAAGLAIDALAPRHAIAYFASLQKAGLAPRSINRRIITARSFLNSLRRDWGTILFAAPQSPFYKGRRNRALIGPSRIKIAAPQSLRVKVPALLNLPLQTEAIRAMLKKLRAQAILPIPLPRVLRRSRAAIAHRHDRSGSPRSLP